MVILELNLVMAAGLLSVRQARLGREVPQGLLCQVQNTRVEPLPLELLAPKPVCCQGSLAKGRVLRRLRWWTRLRGSGGSGSMRR